MKKYFTVLILLALAGSVFGQNTISGTVKSEAGEALVGASVQIKGTFLGTYTGVDGFYELPHVSNGTFVIEISYLGFETKTIEVVITSDKTFDFELSPSAKMVEDVVVTAIKAQDNTPVAKSNISKSDIAKTNLVQDIPYQLDLTPSVVSSSENGTGMGYTSMRIRGTDMTRINVTINGIPLNDAESQGVFWVNMSDFASSVNDVQIQRGVGTSTNGAASFGASINFQTLGITKDPFANISSTIGSFSTFKENIVVGSGIIDSSFAMTIRLSKLDSDGWIKRGFSDHRSLHATASYFTKKDLLTLNVLMGQEQTGITWWGVPDYMIDTDPRFNPAGAYIDDNGNQQFYKGQTDNYWQNHIILNYTREINDASNVNLGIHYTQGKGYYEQYIPEDDGWDINTFAAYGMSNISLMDTVVTIRGVEYIFPDSTITSTDMIRQKWLDNDFYGVTGSYNYKKGRTALNFGAAYNIYAGDHFGLVKWVKMNPEMNKDYEWYRNYGEKTDASGFVKAQYQATSALSLFGDVQVRQINYMMSGPDDDLQSLDQKHDWTFVNPKAGLFYTIDGNSTAFASFAMANREPSRADLKDAVKEGGDVFPQAETLYDYEFGYQYNAQTFALGLNVYYMMYDNQLVQTGELNSVGYPIMTNVKESYRTGLEVSLAAKVTEKVEWIANATISENKIKNYIEYATDYDDDWNEISRAENLGTTDISYSPDMIASNSFIFHPVKHMSFGFISKVVGKQYIDNTSDEARSLEPYAYHNFTMDYVLPLENDNNLRVQFLINNLLDKHYISNAYGGNWFEQGTEYSWVYYYPQAGVNYMLKLTLEL